MWQRGCYRARISGTSQTFTQGSKKTIPASETTPTTPRRGETLVVTCTIAPGYLPSRGSIESSPFQVHEVFQLMVEAHWIADPGSGEGFFQSINIDSNQARPAGHSLYILHIAYFIFTIYFTQSTVVEQRRARSSWYQTSLVVWEMRRGVSK